MFRKGERVYYKFDLDSNYDFVRQDGKRVRIVNTNTGVEIWCDETELTLDPFHFEDDDPALFCADYDVYKPILCEHENSDEPMKRVDKGFTDWYYCVECGEYTEEFKI